MTKLFDKHMTVDSLLIISLGILVWVMVTRAKAGMKIPSINRIPGLEALDEAVGRATEMGRPVHTTHGLGGISNADTFAFWGVLGHVAALCAKYDCKLINTNRDYLVMTVNQEIIRQAYLEAGRPDAYNPDDVRFLSDFQFSYTTNLVGIFARERPAANIMIGYFFAESLILAEVGAQIGAIQIAGTTSVAQLPFFVAACDYTLLGEEIYAASAYISKNPVLVGSLVAEDWFKVLLFLTIITGTITANVIGPKARNWLSLLLVK
jgi:hypothetical protein